MALKCHHIIGLITCSLYLIFLLYEGREERERRKNKIKLLFMFGCSLSRWRARKSYFDNEHFSKRYKLSWPRLRADEKFTWVSAWNESVYFSGIPSNKIQSLQDETIFTQNIAFIIFNDRLFFAFEAKIRLNFFFSKKKCYQLWAVKSLTRKVRPRKYNDRSFFQHHHMWSFPSICLCLPLSDFFFIVTHIKTMTNMNLRNFDL